MADDPNPWEQMAPRATGDTQKRMATAAEQVVGIQPEVSQTTRLHPDLALRQLLCTIPRAWPDRNLRVRVRSTHAIAVSEGWKVSRSASRMPGICLSLANSAFMAAV